MVEDAKRSDALREELEALSFEEALAELERVVERLESEVLPLDEAVELYNRGQALTRRCQHRLDQVELKVEQLAETGAEAQ